MSQSATRRFIMLLFALPVFGLILTANSERTVSARVQQVDLLSVRPIATPPKTEAKPLYNAYKGVSIGMTTDEARTKLGAPADKSDTQDFYNMSENENAQIFYDASHLVYAIAVSYFGKPDAAPKPTDILGSEIAAKPDGSMHKLVRYPKAGYWVSYGRTAGDDPIITVTIQKL